MSSFENDPHAPIVAKAMERVRPYLKDDDGTTYNRVYEAIRMAFIEHDTPKAWVEPCYGCKEKEVVVTHTSVIQTNARHGKRIWCSVPCFFKTLYAEGFNANN